MLGLVEASKAQNSKQSHEGVQGSRLAMGWQGAGQDSTPTSVLKREEHLLWDRNEDGRMNMQDTESVHCCVDE